jgi:hypothetical protein
MRNHYSQMAEHYSALAEVKDLGIVAYSDLPTVVADWRRPAS